MQRSIGQTLRAAREARGLTLLDAAHQTRIPANRLHQLEEDNFAAFGSMAYAKSFLKSYSRYLEVDASAVVDGFPVPVLVGPSDYRYLTETHGPWIERQPRAHRSEPLARTGRSPVPTLVAMFAVFVIAGILLGNHLVARQKTDGKPATTAGDAGAGQAAVSGQSEIVGNGNTQRPANGQAVASEVPQETFIIRPAVLPKNIPAPDGPNTPVRRAEIVN